MIWKSWYGLWSSFLRDAALCRLVVRYRRFGTYRSHLQASCRPRSMTAWSLKMGPKRRQPTTNLGRVISQKIEGLDYRGGSLKSFQDLPRAFDWTQDRQCTYKRNIEARSCKHCCRGKAIRITSTECVCSLSYPACNAHAPYYIVICGLSGSTVFFHIIS